MNKRLCIYQTFLGKKHQNLCIALCGKNLHGLQKIFPREISQKRKLGNKRDIQKICIRSFNQSTLTTSWRGVRLVYMVAFATFIGSHSALLSESLEGCFCEIALVPWKKLKKGHTEGFERGKIEKKLLFACVLLIFLLYIDILSTNRVGWRFFVFLLRPCLGN